MQNKYTLSQSAKKILLCDFLLILPVCIVSVLLFASIGRPVWIDEFLHFAFASFDTTSLAWNAITHSTSNVNHGQTGIYMLVNYWLLKIFGADVLALRAPSLICAVLLCYFSALVIRVRGYGLAWQVFAIFIMFCQSELMYFSGEARPYLPLATASVGTLLYYLASPVQRAKTTISFVGWFSVLLGVFMHPYFSIYWLMIAAFGFWASWFNDEQRLTIKNIAKYLNIPLCLIGTVIYFALASQTWLTGSPEFDRDPFQFMHKSELYYLFIWQHTTFLGPNSGGEGFLIVNLISLVIFSLLPERITKIVKPIIPPIILIYLAFSISILLSFLSYYQNYWILTRQWVASIALVAIGFSWLCAETMSLLIRVFPNKNQRPMHFIIFFSLIFYCGQENQPKTKALWTELTKQLKIVTTQPKKNPPVQIACPISPETWTQLANQNLEEKTPVWGIFKFYYSNDTNPFCI